MRPASRMAGVCAAAVLGLLTALQAALPAAELKTLTPDDLFKLEELGEAAFSPDGQWVAYVRRRPLIATRTHGQPFLQGADRSDVWLAPVTGSAAPVNLTKGERDGAGFFNPIWSPDGARLAMLSTRHQPNEEDNVRLFVWEKASNTLTRLTDRGVEMMQGGSLVWVDSTRLATVLLPAGEQPVRMSVERRMALVAMREWPKTWKGDEAAVSALDSGVPVKLESRPQQTLVILDSTGRGKETTVAQAAAFQYLRRSPDGKHLAFFKQIGAVVPDPAVLLPHGGNSRFSGPERFGLVIVDAAGRAVVEETTDPKVVLPATFTWARDGQAFAFIGTGTTVQPYARDGVAVATTFGAFRGSVGGGATGAIAALALPEMEAKAIAWGAGDRLLVSAERTLKPGEPNPAAKPADAKSTPGDQKPGDQKPVKRTDWFAVSTSTAPRNLTGAMKAVPADLLSEVSGQTFVGLADGDLWRVSADVAGPPPANLTSSLETKLQAVAWPDAAVARHVGIAKLVASNTAAGKTDYVRIDLASGAATAAARPSDLATLTAYRPETDVWIFSAAERTGTFLTAATGADAAQKRTLVEANTYLRDIAEGEFRQIEYTSTEGEPLKAWMILPVGYQAGKKYPLFVWVYAGSVARDAPTILARLNMMHAENLQLLAARGYAVLMPSMPLPAEGTGSDPYMEMTKGVLPAVDKAIELGIADPKRLAVSGQSFGGYSTYALVTQTNRFQAAIALAGLSDLVSLYGIFDARYRYEPDAHENTFRFSIAETGQTRMGNPPWKDIGRFLRNSPLFYADRVKTPLLIMQGDMDYVAMQQGEQFFNAMYRQGKRARFVRYWGEGHVLSSPGNIRNFWTQIFGWLDEHMPPAAPGAATTTSP